MNQDDSKPDRRPFEVIQVWIVGTPQALVPDDEPWQIQGVYTSQELAEEHAEVGWFIGPVLVDTPLPVDPTEWPGAYFIGESHLRLSHGR